VTQFGNNLPNFLIGSGVDTIIGLADADSLVGSTSGRNVLFGNQGNDSLISQAGGDTIYGGQGADIIRSRGGSLLYGERGDDSIVGDSIAGSGAIGAAAISSGDTMYGGDGNDSLVGGVAGPSALFGNTGNDVLAAGNRGDSLFGGQGNDTLTSTVGGLLYGDRGNDNIVLSGSGAAGATVYGGDGDDAITGGGRTLLFGNQGNDSITAGAGDSVYGGSGADVLTAAGSGAFISGDLGNDILNNGGANNTLQGGEGDDSITFNTGAASSIASGGGGKNFLQVLAAAGSGNLLIAGSLGDTLVAGGANSVQGGVGDDSLVSLGSQATLIGGAGRDTFNVLAGGAIAGFNPNEGDTILSGTAPFTIIGGSVGLFLTGTPNRDTLIGGSANDTLEGLGNADVLTGGAGADVFLFRGAAVTEVASVTFNNNLLVVSGTIGAGTAPTVPVQVSYRTNFPGIGAVAPASATFTFTPGGTVAGAGGTVSGIPFGASLSIAYGTGAGIGTSVTPLFGSSSLGTTTGPTVPVPAAGYGYQLTGLDTITDFEVATDQIRLSASLFANGTNTITANAPGVFATFANASGFVGQTASLLYAQDTGILYGRPANVGTFGSQFVYNPTPIFSSGTLLASNAVNGTNTIVTTAGTGGASAIGTLQYFVLPQTNPIQSVAFNGGTTTRLPIPFAQVLSPGGAPVSGLTYGRDVVIF
jgi:Ca2+-binding RTX toxin-like protein